MPDEAAGGEALQRGRARAGAEGFFRTVELALLPAASTGPRPCGRGRRDIFLYPVQSAPASTGPRPCGRGRDQLENQMKQHRLASTGPRPCGRGRISKRYAPVFHRRMLQRGRARAGAEGRCRTKNHSAIHRASTGPRPCGRGRAEEMRTKKIASLSFNGAAPVRARKGLYP